MRWVSMLANMSPLVHDTRACHTSACFSSQATASGVDCHLRSTLRLITPSHPPSRHHTPRTSLVNPLTLELAHLTLLTLLTLLTFLTLLTLLTVLTVVTVLTTCDPLHLRKGYKVRG